MEDLFQREISICMALASSLEVTRQFPARQLPNSITVPILISKHDARNRRPCELKGAVEFCNSVVSKFISCSTSVPRKE